MALTTLDKVKGFLGIAPTNTAKDFQLDALRKAAESLVKSRLKRDLESQTYTDFYCGNGTQRLPLRQKPVTSVTNVWINSAGYYGQNTVLSPAPFGTEDLLTQGVDYALEFDQGSTVSGSGILARLSVVWDEFYYPYLPGRLYHETGVPFGNIKVQYTAGYATIPEDLQYAVATLVAAMQRDGPTGSPLNKERIGDYSYETMGARELYSYGGMPLPHQVESILRRYTEIAV